MGKINETLDLFKTRSITIYFLKIDFWLVHLSTSVRIYRAIILSNNLLDTILQSIRKTYNKQKIIITYLHL
jgi:hypothetical protein